MSKIAEIVSKAKSFTNTNAGQVAVSGLGYMATMAICGGIVAKFFPGKATFGRALGLGLYAVGMQTLVGTSVASEQQQRLEWMEESAETFHREITRLRSEIFRLQEQLCEKGSELERANACIRHAKADMDGTMKCVKELQEKLSAQEEELKHNREALKNRKADIGDNMKYVDELRDENEKLSGILAGIQMSLVEFSATNEYLSEPPAEVSIN